jgi:hypothetical protein
MVVRILQRLIFALLFGTGAVEAQTRATGATRTICWGSL